MTDSVCAWYRSEYDPDTGLPIRKLTDSEYDQIVSHGICAICRECELRHYKGNILANR